jgi:hypothetical protein
VLVTGKPGKTQLPPPFDLSAGFFLSATDRWVNP